MSVTRRPRTRIVVTDESGWGVVEVMVAAAVVLLMAGAAMTVLTRSEVLVAETERQEAAISLAQRELERLRAVRYGKLALTSHPAAAAAGTDLNPSNPNEYVSGSNLLVRSSFRDRTSPPPPGVGPGGEPLVVSGAGSVATGPETVTAGRFTFVVHRYVTWSDQVCVVAGVDRCPGTQDAKRIVVAVAKPSGMKGLRPNKPVWITGLVADPAARPPNTPAPPESSGPGAGTGTGQTAQPFSLSDTRCVNSQRVAAEDSHETHDTARASTSCATAATAPDLMLNSAPPLPPPGSPMPLQLDFSSEISRIGAGAVLRRAGSGCPTSYPTTDSAAGRSQVHRWITPPLPAGFEVGTSGALTLWTRALAVSAGSGTLCLALHRANASGAIAGAPLATHEHTIDPWPGEPSEIIFTFPQASTTLAAGERLALTLALASAAGIPALEIRYDHPSHDSVLSVGTTTPLATS